jgi:hypothetical protein
MLEATWHRTWNLPRRQPCRSPDQEALPRPRDRPATCAWRTTWRFRAGSSCPHTFRPPQSTRKQTASNAGSPTRRASSGLPDVPDRQGSRDGRAAVPWQRVPSAVDEVVVAPAGLNVRLAPGIRHRSEGRRRAGAPTPLQAGRLPPPCRPLGPKGSSLPRRMPREATRGSRSRPRLRKTVPAIGHESRSGDERRRFVRQEHATSRDLVRWHCGRPRPGHRSRRPRREHPTTTPQASSCWIRSPSTPLTPSAKPWSTRASRPRSSCTGVCRDRAPGGLGDDRVHEAAALPGLDRHQACGRQDPGHWRLNSGPHGVPGPRRAGKAESGLAIAGPGLR